MQYSKNVLTTSNACIIQIHLGIGAVITKDKDPTQEEPAEGWEFMER